MVDPILVWIVGTGLAMSAIALVGSLTLVLDPRRLARLQVPLVAMAAGTLVGGALFHLLPSAQRAVPNPQLLWSLVAGGFLTFFLLEQGLHRHHRKHGQSTEPFTWLILVGDGLHNLLGGLAIASAFMVDVGLGVTAWLAAAAHEVPQELGDFAVLVHGGWSKRRALRFNFLSGLAFPVGGLMAYLLGQGVDVAWMVPFAAGNFLYIGASDLVPELHQRQDGRHDLAPVLWFAVGLLVLWLPMMMGTHAGH